MPADSWYGRVQRSAKAALDERSEGACRQSDQCNLQARTQCSRRAWRSREQALARHCTLWEKRPANFELLAGCGARREQFSPDIAHGESIHLAERYALPEQKSALINKFWSIVSAQGSAGMETVHRS